MARSHLVVIKQDDDEIITYPLKQWLRENPDQNPPGMHPDERTSHSLRRGLKKLGWSVQYTANEVFIIQPDDLGDTSYADELIDSKVDEDEDAAGQDFDDVSEITFGLERDLQAALRANIEQLEHGLRITDEGNERITEAGRIDISSEDNQGNYVVIELKAGRATSNVIAQVLSYMAAIADAEEKSVRGMIVAGDFSDRVVLAAKAVSNLDLVRYSFQFSFEKIK